MTTLILVNAEKGGSPRQGYGITGEYLAKYLCIHFPV